MSSTEINDDHGYKASVRREWTAAAAGMAEVARDARSRGRRSGRDPRPARHRPTCNSATSCSTSARDTASRASAPPPPSARTATSPVSTSRATCSPSPRRRARAGRPLQRVLRRGRHRGARAGARQPRRGAEPRSDHVRQRPARDAAPPPQRTATRRPARGGGVGDAGQGCVCDTGRRHDRDCSASSLRPPGPGPFALGADGALEELVRDAGFTDVVASTALAVYETASAEACTEWIRDVAPPITGLIADQPAAVQQDVWDRVTCAWAPFQGPDGAVRLPCTAVCVSARKRTDK